MTVGKQRALTGGEMWRELRLRSLCATCNTTTWWLYTAWRNSWMFYGSWHGYQTFASGNYESSLTEQPLGDEQIFDTRSWLTVWKCKRKQTQSRGTKVYNLKRVAVAYAQSLSSKNWSLLGKNVQFLAKMDIWYVAEEWNTHNIFSCHHLGNLSHCFHSVAKQGERGGGRRKITKHEVKRF